MNPDQAAGAYVDVIYAILWIGALLAATDEIVDPFPDHVVRVAERYSGASHRSPKRRELIGEARSLSSGITLTASGCVQLRRAVE
jgi:hypothetical protein